MSDENQRDSRNYEEHDVSMQSVEEEWIGEQSNITADNFVHDRIQETLCLQNSQNDVSLEAQESSDNQPSQPNDLSLSNLTNSSEETDALRKSLTEDEINHVRNEMVADESSIHCEQPELEATPEKRVCVFYKDIVLATSAEQNIDVDNAIVKTKKQLPLGHIMISYNHSTKIIAMKIAQELTQYGYTVWIDRNNMHGNIIDSMAKAVDDAFVVIFVMNQKYFSSRYCRLEAEYAVMKGKYCVPLVAERNFQATGWLGLITSISKTICFVNSEFSLSFDKLIEEIENISPALSIEPKNMHNNFMTRSSGQNSADVNKQLTPRDWDHNEVITWLQNGKLLMFEESLKYFNGRSLYRLYKIRTTSPRNFYGMVNKLLPATAEGRLYRILTFVEMLESLFSKYTDLA